jgi:hypothetical protein
MLQHYYHWEALLHYLDDFLNIIAGYLLNAQELATEFGNQFDGRCDELGFDVKHKRSFTGISTDFLGLQIDTERMEAMPLAEKHKRTLALVDSLKRKKLSQSELQTAIGFLSFASQVMPLGRPFLKGLYNAMTLVSVRSVKVSDNIYADLQWWQGLLAHWSGITLIRPKWEPVFIWTDAAGKKGIGSYVLVIEEAFPLRNLIPAHAFCARVPPHHRKKHINTKEMIVVLKAVQLWAPILAGREHYLYCDNSGIISGILKKSIKGPAMAALRSLLLEAARWDLERTLIWIPTYENILADALSRHEWDNITNLAPVNPVVIADSEPTDPIIDDDDDAHDITWDPPESWYDDHHILGRQATRYLRWGLCTSTHKIYGTTRRSYSRYCLLAGIRDPFPATAVTVTK